MKNAVILIAAKSAVISDKIRSVLEQVQFTVVDTCTSGSETIRKIRTHSPDLLICDYELGDMNGIQICDIAIRGGLSSVILLCNPIQKEYAESMFEYPLLICLGKPLNKSVLYNTVEISIKSRKGVQHLEKEISKLKNDINTRKVVEKAKGLMIEKLNITETEAYNRLRTQSMETQMPMKTVAAIIIKTME